MVNINIEVPEEIHKKIKILAATKGVSLKDLIVESLEESTNGKK
jgi:predicted HicB family RNase H-like nuclease